MMHVLHIGKTGRGSLSAGLTSLRSRGNVAFHGHDVRLSDVPLGEKVIFCVRHPVSRFVSGFNSRFRKGQPRNMADWTAGGRTAFGRFQTPGRLAAGLRSREADEREAAMTAMNEIYHPARHLSYWLRDAAYVMCRRADIFFIGETSRLNEDFNVLAGKLGLPEGTDLPSDPVGKHATPPDSRHRSPARMSRSSLGGTRTTSPVMRLV